MTISYSPSRDELLLRFHPVRGHPSKEFGRFKVWYEEDRICAVRIRAYYKEEQPEFRKSLKSIRLGGIWKNVTISENDLARARATLLKKLEDNW